MKKLLVLVLATLSTGALWPRAGKAQQTNPQTSFAATLGAANPSLYLNFNDLTTGFTDKVSGTAFVKTVTTPTTVSTTAGILPALTSSSTLGYVIFTAAPLAAGALSSISLQYYVAPAAGPLTMVLGTLSGSTITVNSTFTVNVASTTAVQTFTAGSGFAPINVSAGQLIGTWVPAGGSAVGQSGTEVSGVSRYYFAAASSIPTGAQTWGTSPTTQSLTATVTATATTASTSGAVTPRQTGFDSTQPDNTSAGFATNGFNAAPNTTLGAIDWSTPFSLLVHVDRLNWNRTGSLTFMSKGNVGGSSAAWELVLQMDGTVSQLCFYEDGASSAQGLCTAGSVDAMPNGFNYDVVVTNNGTGANGAAGTGAYAGNVNAVSLYINGLQVGGSANGIAGVPVSAVGAGFGALSFKVSGGTGYAATTPVTITGGGANCTLAGYVMNASGGVPVSITSSGAANPNYGCTSVPAVSLTGATGSGVVITPSLSATTMNSAYPLMVPGYVNSSGAYGVAGTNAAAGTTYVDEAAIFPGVLTASQIAAMFYQTKFYQGLLSARPAAPIAVVFDDDGCGDETNTWALEEAIALDKIGFIELDGVVQEDSAAGNAAYFRQMLDEAGLANVPVGVPSDAAAYSACSATALNTFNATTLSISSYPSASQVYRQVMASHAGAPVAIIIGGELNGLANLMQSGADGISPMTGAQMLARDAANGGEVYSQGGDCTATSPPATMPCAGSIGAQFANATAYADAAAVYGNSAAMPMVAEGGTPAAAGPGPLASRTGKDAATLQMSLLYGTDVRTGFDSLPISALVTPYFTGGVTVGYSGGTGYAATTLFTSTGGGANCNVTGYMTASGGVPNGITTLWGAATPLQDASGVVAGLGYGCTSAPTLTLVSPSGTGAVLTASATTVCGTASFPGSMAQSFATGSCGNQYQGALSQWALSGSNAPVYRWFLNSLVDGPTGGAPKVR